MSQAEEAKLNEVAITFADAFSSFSVDNMKAAKEFYGEILGLNVVEEGPALGIKFETGSKVFLYPKDDHESATFTVLNLKVSDIDAAVDDLTTRGIEFEIYGGEMQTDEKGIFRGADTGHGPNIAWFKDPAGNILSVIEQNREQSGTGKRI